MRYILHKVSLIHRWGGFWEGGSLAKDVIGLSMLTHLSVTRTTFFQPRIGLRHFFLVFVFCLVTGVGVDPLRPINKEEQ